MAKNSFRYLIELIRSAIYGVEAQTFDDVDMNEVLTMARMHRIEHIIYIPLLNDAEFMQSDMGKILKKKHIIGVTKECKQEFEANRIMDAMEQKGIVHMPLKGNIIKKMYPSPDMRQSSDFDMYVPPKDIIAASKVMDSLGYSFNKDDVGSGMHDEYTFGSYVTVEIHKQLMSNDFPKWSKLCDNILKRKILTKGCKYRYEFSKEDYYIYMQLHTIKHLKYSSCGIKAIIDICVYLDKYNDVLDWKYIDSVFKKGNLSEIDKNLRALSDFWFKGVRPENEIIYKLAMYIAKSGAFGTEKQYLSGRKTDETKINRLLRSLFMPVDEMKIKYPVLKKCIILLPLAYLYRAFYSILFRRNVVSDVATKGDNINNEEAEQLYNFRKEIGL